MPTTNTAVAVFDDHASAEDAVKKLTQAGLEMRMLSIVGKGFHTEEQVTGFYNAGDRIKFWGTRGAFWGGFWGLFMGGVFVTLPLMGPVVVVGYLAGTLIAMVEGAVIVGGVSALGAALASIGIPKDSILNYEAAIRADGFLVMARGSADEVARAKAIMSTANASRMDVHAAAERMQPAGSPALVGA